MRGNLTVKNGANSMFLGSYLHCWGKRIWLGDSRRNAHRIKAHPDQTAGNGIEGEYILTGLKGREIAPTITKAIYRRGLEGGIGTCSIHWIRRTVSSRLNQFYDRAIVSHIMGHTEEVNQNHYDYDMEEIQRKKDTMDQLYAGWKQLVSSCIQTFWSIKRGKNVEKSTLLPSLEP